MRDKTGKKHLACAQLEFRRSEVTAGPRIVYETRTQSVRSTPYIQAGY